MVGAIIPEGTDSILRSGNYVKPLPSTELWDGETKWGSPFGAAPKQRRSEQIYS